MRAIISDYGDHLKEALKWLSDKLKHDPKQNPDELIGQAIYRFDLPLMEAELMSIVLADVSKRSKPTYPWTDFGL